MKEIIPLKKDILFKTIIGEITNIELNHDYSINNDLVSGNVIVSGTYKMTEASVLEDEFYYKIPFGVSLSKRVNKDTIKIEIDDFKYEINKDILSVNIDLEFSCEEEKLNEEVIEEDISDYFNEEIETTINNDKTDIDIDENITNITNNFVSTNKYYTYKIYIVRQGDTLETICNKYNTTIDSIKEYNDISNINVGDKILIPESNV